MGARRRQSAAGISRLCAVGAAGLLAATTSLVGVAATGASATTTDGEAARVVDSMGKWAPAGLATIHPGVVTLTNGTGQCTGNFLFTDAAKNVYLGQAAHCSSTGQATETNGCESKSLPLGTKVSIGASGVTGKLAYNSWRSMQKVSEKDSDACAFNDLALIKLPASAVSKANPTVPVFGGPVGLNTTGTSSGEQVSTFGSSSLRQGLTALSPKSGTSLGTVGNGWSHTVYTLTPGIPGDSGSAFLDSQGRALGVLSTLAVAPQPLSNQVSDLSRQLDYAREHSGIKGLRLVQGTEPFKSATLAL